MNVTTKIIASHLTERDGVPPPGDEICLRVDQTLLQDATGTMACLQFLELERERVAVPLAVQYVDHNLIQLDFKNPDDHRFLQAFARKYGLYYSRPGNGICHYVHVERFARPGQILVGADSHTTTSGSCAMLAIGAGGLDVAVCMAGEPFEIKMPVVVGVELRGQLQPWVQAKDIILELLRRRNVRGGLGRVFEFYGEGLGSIGMTGRMTIANMIAELGATSAVFPSDERARDWFRYQDRLDQWQPLAADAGATYDEQEVINLAGLEPLIAKPSSPGNVVPVREVAGTEVAQVCIGSSVNSGYEDLAIVAAVLRGKTVADNLVMTVTPGSRQILDVIAQTGVYRDLILAGARMLEPACGPCVGMGQAPPSGAVSVRTFNRNFPGRSGTDNDLVYLCSPATAAATALNGVITDPRSLGPTEPSYAPALANPLADDRQIIPPASPPEARDIELPRGPNIKPPPPQAPLPQQLQGRVLIKVGDDISTGDLAPDGAVVMAFRSNVPAIAQFTFRRIDPDFAKRCKEWGGGFIVGGYNYGQGSSREHAALAPKALGVQAVVAKTFARIHRRNLISQGIPPLTFEDEADYERIQQGDTWTMPDIHQALEEGRDRVIVHVANGAPIRLCLPFSATEREVLLAGGLLGHIKQGGRPLSVGQAVSGAVDQGSPVTNPTADKPEDEATAGAGVGVEEPVGSEAPGD